MSANMDSLTLLERHDYISLFLQIPVSALSYLSVSLLSICLSLSLLSFLVPVNLSVSNFVGHVYVFLYLSCLSFCLISLSISPASLVSCLFVHLSCLSVSPICQPLPFSLLAVDVASSACKRFFL